MAEHSVPNAANMAVYMADRAADMAALDSALPKRDSIDVPRLRKVLEYLTEHPEEHDQGIWIASPYYTGCGTTACVAGHVVLADGWAPDYRIAYPEYCVKDGKTRRIAHVAEALLGLRPEQAAQLFWATNELADLWRMAEEFTDGTIQVPPGLAEPELDVDIVEWRDETWDRLQDAADQLSQRGERR